MAEVDIAPRFGQELKDGFKVTNSWVGNGIAWLDELQAYYRERGVLEKEHGAKLTALAKKYFEKKAKKASSLSVGDTPALTPGSLECASLTTWSTQLTDLETLAGEHDRFGSELIKYVAEPLAALATRSEELRKRYMDYAVKLEKERDTVYADLKKTKGKYDATCQDVESRRKKADGAHDNTKVQNAYQLQVLDMHNAKNSYLINIHVANKHKEQYYHESIPALLNSLQDLSEARTSKLNTLWSHAAIIENSMLKRRIEHTEFMMAEVKRNVPTMDSMMFVRHNATSFQEPGDKLFEPCAVWHDDDVMVLDGPAKVFLRNMLGKSKAQLSELRREVDKKRREVENAQRVKEAIVAGKDKRDQVEVLKSILTFQEDFHEADHKRLTAETETTIITTATGDLTLGSRVHNFKSQTFKIPTNCDLCGERIWGLSAKGFDCRDCGYTCHSKCEMKVPAECPGEQSKEERKRLKMDRQAYANAMKEAPRPSSANGTHELPAISRSNTMTSLSSGYAASGRHSASGRASPSDDGAAPTPPERSATLKPMAAAAAGKKNRVIAPPPAAYISELPGSTPAATSAPSSDAKGKMLYAYDANDPAEVTVVEGAEVTLLGPDDGGWTRVRAGVREGLVPTSYIETLTPPTTTHSSSSAVGVGMLPSGRPSSTYSNSGSSMNSGAAAGKKHGPAVAPRRGAKKLRYVEALYAYTAQSETEHSLVEGERCVLIRDDPGDGWAEVEKNGKVASVPASYVQAA